MQLVQQAQDVHDQCSAWKAEISARVAHCHDASDSVIVSGGLEVAGKHWAEWIDLDILPRLAGRCLGEAGRDARGRAVALLSLSAIAFARRAAGSCSPESAPPAAGASEKPAAEHQEGLAVSPRPQQRREVFARAAKPLLVATKLPQPAAVKVDSGLSALRRGNNYVDIIYGQVRSIAPFHCRRCRRRHRRHLRVLNHEEDAECSRLVSV